MNEHVTGIIEVRDLRKRYGNREVLTGLNLSVQPGEVYALLGPNGAGKSTAIEIMEGFRKPDGGEVTVAGENPLAAPREWRDRVGIVAQQTDDLGVYTPRELVSHFAKFYSGPLPADEVLSMVGLTEHARARAAKLSGGQKRRLDVALGIVGSPDVLFLDEPTTGFDPEARREFWAMLQSLTAEGTTILLTTHYLDEAAVLADRVGVLRDGALIAEAAPEHLGGADARTPIVRWKREDGELRSERTDQPGALVARLVAEGEPRALEIIRPSLEDIYLELIGNTRETSFENTEVLQ